MNRRHNVIRSGGDSYGGVHMDMLVMTSWNDKGVASEY